METPDRSTNEGKQRFLEENDGLSTYQLAVLAGKSASTIRNWKRKFQQPLKKSPFNHKPSGNSRPIEHVDDKSIWDNEEWFRQKYEIERIGIPTISKIISRSPALVSSKLDRYGVEIRKHAESVCSTNPCCNKDWLMAHYVTDEEYAHWLKQLDKDPTVSRHPEAPLSLSRCAAEASVVPYTIYNWLTKFDMNIRDIHDAMSGELNPFYGKTHTTETRQRISAAIKKRSNQRDRDNQDQAQS